MNTERKLRERPELLSPAGDWEAMRAAVANGADAVYFGLSHFNARARATNFTLDELPEVMRFLHARNVRGFVTMNIGTQSDAAKVRPGPCHAIDEIPAFIWQVSRWQTENDLQGHHSVFAKATQASRLHQVFGKLTNSSSSGRPL